MLNLVEQQEKILQVSGQQETLVSDGQTMMAMMMMMQDNSLRIHNSY